MVPAVHLTWASVQFRYASYPVHWSMLSHCEMSACDGGGSFGHGSTCEHKAAFEDLLDDEHATAPTSTATNTPAVLLMAHPEAPR